MISAVALRARIEARELAPEDAIRQSLEAIAASDGELRAFDATTAEGALASAATWKGESAPQEPGPSIDGARVI